MGHMASKTHICWKRCNRYNLPYLHRFCYASLKKKKGRADKHVEILLFTLSPTHQHQFTWYSTSRIVSTTLCVLKHQGLNQVSRSLQCKTQNISTIPYIFIKYGQNMVDVSSIESRSVCLVFRNKWSWPLGEGLGSKFCYKDKN